MQKPNLSFSAPQAEEIPLLLSLMQDFYAFDGYPFNPDLTRQNLNRFISDNSLGFTRFIYEEDQLAGYLIVCFGFSFEFGGRDAFLDELYLNPDFRGRGIGAQAVEYAAVECGKHEVKALHLEVELKNDRAFNLYKNMGFKEHTRRLMTKYIPDSTGSE